MINQKTVMQLLNELGYSEVAKKDFDEAIRRALSFLQFTIKQYVEDKS